MTVDGLQRFTQTTAAMLRLVRTTRTMKMYHRRRQPRTTGGTTVITIQLRKPWTRMMRKTKRWMTKMLVLALTRVMVWRAVLIRGNIL
ncbi:hypothetical protein JG687_00013425 [Phytophthora cactorum]|uniref:Uncharacterized protein n=1 Tax=Phytophthora cactorum TaxID=29920 RepID=A0A8T1TZD8_9STRA|nr:hypothetical protein JG687_00013425 [Phytophthora cactorum]